MLGNEPLSRRDVPEAIRIEGRVFRPEMMRGVKRVLVVPFSAGVDAIADDALDQAALAMVRGIADGVMARAQPFEISMRMEEEADMILQGRIDRMAVQGRWKRYFGMHPIRHFTVSGRAMSPEGDIIMVFSHTLQGRYQDKNFSDLASEMGDQIACFVVGVLKE